MSFKPFKFVYTPPPTVPAEPADTETSPTVAVSAAESRAAEVSLGLDELIATSHYLQQAIVDKYRDVGVNLDFNAKPDLAIALTRLYGVDEPPQTITVPMFNRLLDAQATAAVEESLLGDASSAEVNVIQRSDLILVNKEVESQLIDSLEFKNQIPTLLRSLKEDVVVYSAWQAGLKQYPIMGLPGPQSLTALINVTPGPVGHELTEIKYGDLTLPLYNYLTSYMNRALGIYGATYGIMSGINAIERDLTNVVESYILQPIADVTRIVGLLQSLKGLFHKESLHALADEMEDYVFSVALGELGSMTFMLDRFASIILNPLRNITGQIGLLVKTVEGAAASVGRATSGLKGMLKSNPCTGGPQGLGPAHNYHIPGVSDGVQQLGEYLNWGLHVTSDQRQFVDEQFRKLAERRLHRGRDRNQLLCSLRALDTLIGIAKGLVDQHQPGAPYSIAGPLQQREAMTQVLSGLAQGTQNSYVIQDKDVVITSPAMPKPTAQVRRALKKAGLEIVDGETFVRVKGVLSNG